MKKKRIFAVGAVTVALAMGLSACAADNSDTAGGDGDGLDIGIVTFSATDVAVSNLVRGAQEQAKELGYKSTLIDANGSVDQANSAIQNLVQKKVDAIVVTVFAASALATGLSAAETAGIPVLLEGGGQGAGVSYNLDDSLGTPLTEAMIADLPKGGQVLALNYRGGRPCQLREAAFDKAVKGITNLKINKQEVTVPGQVETARAATIAWLAATKVVPGKTAIWTCFDDVALGAISALKEQGVKGVFVYSANGTADALNAIDEGYMHTDMWIDLYQSGKDMVSAVKEIKDAGSSWKYKEVPAKYELVTSDNLAKFRAEHPEIK